MMKWWQLGLLAAGMAIGFPILVASGAWLTFTLLTMFLGSRP